MRLLSAFDNLLQTPGEWLEFSPILTLIIGALGVGYLMDVFATKGGLAAMDLNTYTFMFIIAGMLLHWTPKDFLGAAASGSSKPRMCWRPQIN